MANERDEEQRVIEILARHGIKMDVAGCGCCGSPWAKFEYNDEVIFEGYDFAIQMTAREDA